jgi:hypothetical protein
LKTSPDVDSSSSSSPHSVVFQGPAREPQAQPQPGNSPDGFVGSSSSDPCGSPDRETAGKVSRWQEWTLKQSSVDLIQDLNRLGCGLLDLRLTDNY